NGGAPLGDDHRVFNVLDASHQPNFTDVDLLQPGFHKAAAGIHVVARELLLDLRQAQAVSDQFIGVNPNLIFTRRPAETRDVHDIRHSLQVLLHNPIFDGLQLHDVILGIAAVQREKIDLPHRAPVRAHAWDYACRQTDLGKPLQYSLAVLEIVFIVVKDELQIGKSK